MQNATVGVRRIVMRLLPGPERQLTLRVASARRRSVALAATLQNRMAGVVHGTKAAPLGRHDTGAHRVRRMQSLVTRSGRFAGRSRQVLPARFGEALRGLIVRERFLGVGVALLVLVASVLSFGANPGTVAGGTGNTGTDFTGTQSRIGIAALEAGDNGGVGGTDQVGPTDIGSGAAQVDPSTDPQGPFLDDGTLVMPVAVDTTVDDGSALLKSYRVKSGDTLTGIAHHFGVSMMSIWWANQISSKDRLHIGQTLVIPPVSGVVVTVAAGDTLDSIAKKYATAADEILSYNGLTEPNLVIGQKLIVPDAIGKGIPAPKATPAPKTTSSGGGSTSSSGGGTAIHPSTGSYGGGNFAWPVPGGFISQYFHYGHPALDIAAPYGSRIVAAAAGTVIFAGWKDNMGGYQVWVSHGSNLYTGYYHMSAITVSIGEHVGRGEQIGRVGQSGVATGPHCHFEVWRGYPWQGSSYRVNPLAYL